MTRQLKQDALMSDPDQREWLPPAEDMQRETAWIKVLQARVAKLEKAMITVENMLRHPTDPFVMVNAANYLNQERAE